MKPTLFLVLSLLCSVLPSAARSDRNVQIKLTLSPKIAEVAQMIYLYGRDGNQCEIYDSVATQPNKREYILHGYAPYETVLELAFARRGPAQLKLLAHPKEKLKVAINDDDDRVGGAMYKHLGGAHWANDSLAAFWDRLYADARTRIVLMDSMSIAGLSEQKLASLRTRFDANESDNNEFIRKTALTSPSPYVSKSATSLLMGTNEYRATLDSVRKRFPYYYPL